MQKDLFGGTAAVAMPEVMGAKLSFLDRYRMSVRMDQALFLLIGLLVVYVLVFSFGVETGKRYAMAELKAERMKREHMVEELRSKMFPAAMPVETSAAKTVNTPSSLEAQAAAINTMMPREIPAPAAATEAAPASTAEAAQGTVDIKTAKYTIQALTIASRATAEKEIQRLAQKGMKGFIISKGKLHMICVNGFDTRENANRNLKELKTQRLVPADAYVRPMAA